MFLRSILIVLVFFISSCGEPKLPSPFHAAELAAKYTGADFKLIDHNGKPRTLQDFRGKVVVLFFGYMHCPDVCPTTMADLSQVMARLGRDADRVQVLFVTVDPERDTQALLAQYVPAFHPSFLGLYGDTGSTAQVAKVFNVMYQKQATPTGYNVDHSAGSFLIDTDGRARLLSPFAQRTDWLEQDIRLLLALGKS
ncbi:MAG: SCO family protein [Nitrosomonadales bacterium]